MRLYSGGCRGGGESLLFGFLVVLKDGMEKEEGESHSLSNEVLIFES